MVCNLRDRLPKLPWVPEVGLPAIAVWDPKEVNAGQMVTSKARASSRGEGRNGSVVPTPEVAAATKPLAGTGHSPHIPGNLCSLALLRNTQLGAKSPRGAHKPAWTLATSYRPWLQQAPFSSVQSLSRVWLQPRESQHTRSPCPPPTPGAYSHSCPSSWWCHPTISFSVVLFSSCPQSDPASGAFPMSQLFAWGGRSIGVSASASVLPMNTQNWSPLGWTHWISLLSKGLSRVFSNTTVQKHHFFSTQLSSQYNSHIHAWPLEKP